MRIKLHPFKCNLPLLGDLQKGGHPFVLSGDNYEEHRESSFYKHTHTHLQDLIHFPSCFARRGKGGRDIGLAWLALKERLHDKTFALKSSIEEIIHKIL